MPTAYSYIRFSSTQQEQGDSERRQMAGTKEYCEKNNLTLSDKSFRDLGLSGFKDIIRPELSEMLTAVNEGVIKKDDYIILENLDRLSRQGIDATLDTLRSILRNDVYVVSLQDGLKLNRDSLNNLTDMMRIVVSADLGYQESLKKQERLSRAWEQKQRLAAESKVPKTSTCPSWLEISKDKSKYEVVEDKAAIVRRVFEMSANGIGRRKICEILTKEGVPHIYTKTKRASGKWHPSYIAKLFNNGAVIGRFVPSKLDPSGKRVPDISNAIDDYFPAIISEELFRKVQYRKKQIGCRSGGRRGNTMANLIQGFSKCFKCGGSMSYRVKNKSKNETYLGCLNSLSGRCSHKDTYRYDLVEKAFLTAVYSNNKELFPIEDTSGNIETIARKENELSQIDEKIKHLLKAENIPQVMSDIQGLGKKQESLKNEVEELKSNVAESKLNTKEKLWGLLTEEVFKNDAESRIRLNDYIKRSKIKLIFEANKDSKQISLVTRTKFHSEYIEIGCLWFDFKGRRIICSCENENEETEDLFTVERINGTIVVNKTENFIPLTV